MQRKKYPSPSQEDLETWFRVKNDLSFWLYQGITGKMQIMGHKKIDEWMQDQKAAICLEIGCGPGHHLQYSHLANDNYFGLDIDYAFLEIFQKTHSTVPLIQGDAYRLPLQANSVDIVISIYNLEHLRRLEECLLETCRILKPDGLFLAAVPAEGGFLYNLGRNFSSKPYMERKYGIDYDAIVHYEHCNDFTLIKSKLKKLFQIQKVFYYPFPFLKIHHLNIVVCFALKKKSEKKRISNHFREASKIKRSG